MFDPIEETLNEIFVLKTGGFKFEVEKDQLYGMKTRFSQMSYQSKSSYLLSAFEIKYGVDGFSSKTSVGYQAEELVNVKTLATFDTNMVLSKDSDLIYPPLVLSTLIDFPLSSEVFVGLTGKLDYRNNLYDFGLKFQMIQ